MAETYVANHVALENGEQPIAYSDDDDDDDDGDDKGNEDGHEEEKPSQDDSEEENAIVPVSEHPSEDVANVLYDNPVKHHQE